MWNIPIQIEKIVYFYPASEQHVLCSDFQTFVKVKRELYHVYIELYVKFFSCLHKNSSCIANFTKEFFKK